MKGLCEWKPNECKWYGIEKLKGKNDKKKKGTIDGYC